MTIKEIAQLAGVSSSAVSRYLNGGYISEEKKEQIKKVISETGYQPSAQARTLRTKRGQLVGVVVPKINSESISRVTEGIGKILSERGYHMLLASTDNNTDKELFYLSLFEKYPVDGIILIGTMITPGHRKFLKETGIPVVVVGQHTKYANCIYHDDYEAGKAMGKYAAAYLAEKSIKGEEKSAEAVQGAKKGVEKNTEEWRGRAAYISVTREDKSAGAAREDGFKAGFKAGGMTLEESCIRVSAFTTDSGYEKAKELLVEESDIDIICCATDTIAAGAIRAVKECGREGIRVTGFGDNQLLKAATGGIPTIHFGYKTSGIRGAELLLDVIERGEKIPMEIKLGFRFVDSVRAI